MSKRMEVSAELEHFVIETVESEKREPEQQTASAVTPQAQELTDMQTQMTATIALGAITSTTQLLTGAPIELAPEHQQMWMDKMTPLLAKYGGQAPEWLIKWREEIDALSALGIVGFSIWNQVQANKQAEAANDPLSESSETQEAA